jgi:hypothetical protein
MAFLGELVSGHGDRRLQPVTTVVSHRRFVEDTHPDLQVGVVRPWLLVGSWDAAADPHTLTVHRCTHVLCLVPGNPPCLPAQLTTSLIRETVPFLDVPDTDLAADGALTSCIRFIEKCRDVGGVVLVHCNAGCSRAPTVVMVRRRACSRACKGATPRLPTWCVYSGVFRTKYGLHSRARPNPRAFLFVVADPSLAHVLGTVVLDAARRIGVW